MKPQMTQWQRWSYASKPGSWPKLLVPTFFGQVMGVVGSGTFSWAAALLGLVFTIFLGLFIVWFNDWADQGVDTLKRKLFPDGCSPKTIPDGILPARSLFWGGLGAGSLAFATGLLAELVLGHLYLGTAGFVCLVIFVAYSLPPLRLNYRGGGELLEMVGVGLALPLWNAYSQGMVPESVLALYGGSLVLALSSALASGLSDEVSDRVGGKRTFTTWRGNRATRTLVEACLPLGALAWGVGCVVAPALLPAWCVVAAVVPLLWFGRGVLRASAKAQTNAFKAQKQYKHQLHLALWVSHVTLGLALIIHHGFVAEGA